MTEKSVGPRVYGICGGAAYRSADEKPEDGISPLQIERECEKKDCAACRCGDEGIRVAEKASVGEKR